MRKILAIDPGDQESGYVIWDGKVVSNKGKIPNEIMLDSISKMIGEPSEEPLELAIEMVASYGMPVGKNIFDTCVWIGRFIQEYESIIGYNYKKVYRQEVKMHLCKSTRAKDSNVIQALVDRFGNVNEHGKYGKGTKKNKGFFYEFSDDIWQAFAVAVYYFDTYK